MAEPRRDWTTVGEQAYVTSEGRRRKAALAIASLDWSLPAETLGSDWIEEIAFAGKRLRITAPLRTTGTDALAPYRLYGLECKEINGLVRYYLLNMNGTYFVLAADFWPNEIGQRQPREETL